MDKVNFQYVNQSINQQSINRSINLDLLKTGLTTKTTARSTGEVQLIGRQGPQFSSANFSKIHRIVFIPPLTAAKFPHYSH